MLTAKQLRKLPEEGIAIELPRNPITLIADSIYDTINVGCLFRLADAIAAQEIILCGKTEQLPNKKIHLGSCGTHKVVKWSYQDTAEQAIEFSRAQQKDLTVLAIEQSERSIHYHKCDYKFPLALLVGNESFGVRKEVLALVDGVVEIPMFGYNSSLNVVNAAAIVAYQALQGYHG